MKRYTFEEVNRLDDELHQLALYASTEGKIIIPTSASEILDLQEDVAEKFNYFKKLIHDGEATIDFIKYDVLSTYGPFEKEKIGEDDIDINDITKYIEEKDEQREQGEDIYQMNGNKNILDFLEALIDIKRDAHSNSSSQDDDSDNPDYEERNEE